MQNEHEVVFRKEDADGVALELICPTDAHDYVRVVVGDAGHFFSIKLTPEEAWKLRQALLRR
jgi:hypothetical protein